MAFRTFRVARFLRRQRDAANAVDGAPTAVPAGEMLYGEAEDKVYFGKEDGTVATVGGNPFDQTLNTTDAVTFSSINLPNNTQITVGSFDNMTGGNNGIGLHCYVGYELNWQGGRLRNVAIGDTEGTPQILYVDSTMSFSGPGPNDMQISGLGLTFPDGTTQNTAATLTSNPTNTPGASAFSNILKITQTAYDALAVKDENTLYVISD